MSVRAIERVRTTGLKSITALSSISDTASTGCFTGTGEKYRANVSVTEKGFICQQWNATKPRYHLLSPEDYPEIQGGHNYCRNPGGNKKKPWCFTTGDHTEFDFCDIPRCGECRKPCHSKPLLRAIVLFDNSTSQTTTTTTSSSSS